MVGMLVLLYQSERRGPAGAADRFWRREMADIVALKRSKPEEAVSGSVDHGILRITLANPPANALSLEVMTALQGELDRARDQKSVRVIVIAGSGKIFCAGHDLKQMNARRADPDRGKAYFEETFAVCSRLMQSIVRHPKPVIAEVARHGRRQPAVPACSPCCDLAVASQRQGNCFGGERRQLSACSARRPSVALVRGLLPRSRRWRCC